MCHIRTHEIMSEALSGASVNEHDTVRIDVSDVHRGALHFRISESHLHVYVVDALKKVAEVTSRRLYRAVVPVIESAYVWSFVPNFSCFSFYFLRCLLYSFMQTRERRPVCNGLVIFPAINHCRRGVPHTPGRVYAETRRARTQRSRDTRNVKPSGRRPPGITTIRSTLLCHSAGEITSAFSLFSNLRRSMRLPTVEYAIFAFVESSTMRHSIFRFIAKNDSRV